MAPNHSCFSISALRTGDSLNVNVLFPFPGCRDHVGYGPSQSHRHRGEWPALGPSPRVAELAAT